MGINKPKEAMKNNNLYIFTDERGNFKSFFADKLKSLYLPLCNQTLMSSISPDLHGDIKSSQNSFLLEPVSRINLSLSRASRNFWVYINQDTIWSATGVSKNLKQIEQDKFTLEAGQLWQRISRENRNIGLKSAILSFVPAGRQALEVMQVSLTNISKKKISFIPYAAIPLYARSADNLRDHRHVTSLLTRIKEEKYGIKVKPTLLFDESGHKPNNTVYFAAACDNKGKPARYIYPTQESFCGDSGDLEAPEAVFKNKLPQETSIQGKEPMAALRFAEVNLSPGAQVTYIMVMGLSQKDCNLSSLISKFGQSKKVGAHFEKTKKFWQEQSKVLDVSSGNKNFDNWLRWVNIQPILRKIFGCSFLPDFDYGKGGRGWRDLWQDCLGLILNNPQAVRPLLINNFCGVKIDGSNATIIGKKPGEFIADRNNISRVWMDHGVWPLITTDLYINESGDLNILFAEAPYFRDQHVWRSTKINPNWNKGKSYQGLVYEHLLIQNLTQFFNVGSHNHIRLEGADWNDGLDMAKEFGESVTFSAMYAQNLNRLAELLLKSGKKKILLAQEINILLKHFNYSDRNGKRKILENYFAQVENGISGRKISVDVDTLARNLKIKSLWMAQHIRENEWLKEGFFNGYYDNQKKRVEGRVKGLLRMCLASQVFPIISGVADNQQITKIIKSVNKRLLDKQLKGYHLNTNFKEEQHNLGRAFSFAYGDKENGAIFSHMVVMYAYGLYTRGLAKEGWKALSSLYKLSVDTTKSKIYPCLPEYFNSEGRGMYVYLTGSASWFMLTLLTQAFGARGENGDLLIEPKLTAEQFDKHATISISRIFAGSKLQLNFSNPKKLDYGKYKIVKVTLNSKPLSLADTHRILINRSVLLENPSNTIAIVLG